jgi:hypothetical protein
MGRSFGRISARPRRQTLDLLAIGDPGTKPRIRLLWARFAGGSAMEKAEEYRANAMRALIEAKASADIEHKKLMFRLADAWLELADGNAVMTGAEFDDLVLDIAKRPSQVH